MSAKRAERLQVMLTIDEVRRVEEWRFENRMPSRSAAVRALMNLGLRAHAAVDEAALLEGALSSQDVGVVDAGPAVGAPENRPAALVVAGDRLVGEGLGRLLERAGFRVVGPALGADEARALVAAGGVGVAVIDAGAGDEAVARVADRLVARDIPFAVVADAGYEAPPGIAAARVVARANAANELAGALAGMVS